MEGHSEENGVDKETDIENVEDDAYKTDKTPETNIPENKEEHKEVEKETVAWKGMGRIRPLRPTSQTWTCQCTQQAEQTQPMNKTTRMIVETLMPVSYPAPS